MGFRLWGALFFIEELCLLSLKLDTSLRMLADQVKEFIAGR